MLSSELLVLSDVPVPAPAVILRAKTRPPDVRRLLARRMRKSTDCLIVASMIDPVADGVHLAARDRYPQEYEGIVGRSCHRIEDLERAEREGVHYVTVSPVFETASKPGYGPPLGLAKLSEITSRSRLPVYALGGIGPEQVAGCRRAGAAGVAVAGAVARSDDPAKVIDELLAAWQNA